MCLRRNSRMMSNFRLAWTNREEILLPQRRKGAKKTLRNAVALCAFAALRESSSLKVRKTHAFQAVLSCHIHVLNSQPVGQKHGTIRLYNTHDIFGARCTHVGDRY